MEEHLKGLDERLIRMESAVQSMSKNIGDFVTAQREHNKDTDKTIAALAEKVSEKGQITWKLVAILVATVISILSPIATCFGMYVQMVSGQHVITETGLKENILHIEARLISADQAQAEEMARRAEWMLETSEKIKDVESKTERNTADLLTISDDRWSVDMHKLYAELEDQKHGRINDRVTALQELVKHQIRALEKP